MSQLVPAILTDNPQTLEAMVHQAETFASYVQFDIMDGVFVPSNSINYQHLARIPMKLDWEAHLMVESPEKYLEGLKQAGAQKVVFHYEAAPSPKEVISQLRKLNLAVGLAINPETPNSAILPLTDKVDSLLFLSVHPGFYGSKFMPEVLDKIKDLHRQCPVLEIGIDGGIKEDNIATAARSGVDYIYIGSAVFLRENPGDSYRYLNKLVQETPV
jgi:ribulose-phosphate 3-epimerase